ncbi:MAG TPA: hypothetical protein VEW67_07310 [Thermoleophilaceae bacterium]|nr:hypothetical protein [Thermoleophilaceae bacterium]
MSQPTVAQRRAPGRRRRRRHLLQADDVGAGGRYGGGLGGQPRDAAGDVPRQNAQLGHGRADRGRASS